MDNKLSPRSLPRPGTAIASEAATRRLSSPLHSCSKPLWLVSSTSHLWTASLCREKRQIVWRTFTHFRRKKARTRQSSGLSRSPRPLQPDSGVTSRAATRCGRQSRWRSTRPRCTGPKTIWNTHRTEDHRQRCRPIWADQKLKPTSGFNMAPSRNVETKQGAQVSQLQKGLLCACAPGIFRRLPLDLWHHRVKETARWG